MTPVPHSGPRSARSRLLPAHLLLWFTIAVLVAAGLLYIKADGPQASSCCRHLTQAEWQVADTPGFSAPATSVDSAALPPRWRPAILPLALAMAPDASLLDAGHGARVTWLRLAAPALPAAAGPLALYGVRIKTDGTIAVYVNGQLVHRAQPQGPLWNSMFTPLWMVLDQQAGAAAPREILIRVEHTPQFQVAASSLWLGPADALRARYHLRLWLQKELPAMLNAAFLAVGVFALFVWFRRRHESAYLLFFNLAATSFVAHLHYFVDLPLTSDWFGWLTLNSLYWLIVVMHFFLRQLHGRALTWLTRILIGASAASGLLTLPLSLPWTLPATPVVLAGLYAVVALMGGTVALVGGVSAWRRSAEGRLIASSLCLCVLLGVSDWLLHNNFIGPENWFLGAYTNAVTFLFFSVLMYQRYAGAIGAVELLNASLAQRLQVREAELELSHQRLRAVELRQTISDERQRLMQDMHDGLGSSLISAIRAVERDSMSETEVSKVLRDCLDDLKLTIDSMEPVDADLLLLLATLRFRLEPRLESAGVELLWQVRDVPPLAWLDPSSSLHILRIVQESIANILHHTSASRIRVETAAEADGVRIAVSDNGGGFDIDAALASASGRGLANQQRRASAIGATVAWTTGPAGTRFTLRLPFSVDGKQG